MHQHLQAPLLPHAEAAFRKAILMDLRVGQSTADSIAGRLVCPTVIVETVCASLIQDRLVETLIVAEVLTVYRATARGLESITIPKP